MNKSAISVNSLDRLQKNQSLCPRRVHNTIKHLNISDIYRILFNCTWKHKERQTERQTHYILGRYKSINFKTLKSYRLCSLAIRELN